MKVKVIDLPPADLVAGTDVLLLEQNSGTKNTTVTKLISDLGLVTNTTLAANSAAQRIGTKSGNNVQVELDKIKLNATQTQEELNNHLLNDREQWRRSLAEAGLTLVEGSFEEGATATKATDAVWYIAGGQCYTWDGAFPKTVAAGSTPASAGGTGAGKWLSVGDAVLRGQLANPDIGDSLVAVKAPFSNAIVRTQHDINSERVSVKNWGATGDGTTDDTAAIQAACNDLQAAYAVDRVRRTLVFPDGSYRTSSTIVVHANMSIDCSGRVVFQNKGTAKNFDAVELQGGAKKSVLGTIDGYASGILIRGSTHNVEFQTISNCVDGVIFRADTNWTATKSSLDNVVRGVQIGKCTNGIVFEQNADGLVQQGNEVRVNFISETPNSLLFRNYDGFTHTRMSNWDSNFIELIASDPITLADASMIRNSTPHSVSNVTYIIRSWCGGWTPDGGTMCLIRGAFLTSTFSFSLATRPGLNELVDAAGKNSFGSCSFHVPRYDNLGSSLSFYQAVSAGASFNGGVSLYRSKFRIRATVPDIGAGQTYGLAFNHILAQASGIGRFRIEQYSDSARGKYLIEIRDAGAEQQGMVRLWFTNITNATVPGRDVDLIISAS